MGTFLGFSLGAHVAVAFAAVGWLPEAGASKRTAPALAFESTRSLEDMGDQMPETEMQRVPEEPERDLLAQSPEEPSLREIEEAPRALGEAPTESAAVAMWEPDFDLSRLRVASLEARAPAQSETPAVTAEPVSPSVPAAAASPASLAPSALVVSARRDPAASPEPEYPRAARRRGYQGTVLLEVQVAADGSVVSVEIQESSGHAILDEAARAAVERWRFLPGTRDGSQVESQVLVPIVWRLAR